MGPGSLQEPGNDVLLLLMLLTSSSLTWIFLGPHPEPPPNIL